MMSSVTWESCDHTGLTYNVCNGSGPEESAVKECHSMNIMNVQTNVRQHVLYIYKYSRA